MTKKSKKILFVITKSNFGGAQRYVYELATHLPATQYEVHVACGGNGILVKKLRSAGVTVHTIQNFERDIHFRKELGSLTELYALIQSIKPDIVHLNSSKAGGSGALIARLCKVPTIIFTAHGWPFFEKRSFFLRILMWIISYITAILSHTTIVVSTHDKKHSYMPGIHKKILVIHTGIPDISHIERSVARAKLFDTAILKKHIDDIWVVSTSEHTKNKNLFFLLDAVSKYNLTGNKKVFLSLVGEGEETQALKAYAESLGIASCVHFTGYIEGIRTYLHAFDIFALPSIKEGFPYGLLEAGSARLFSIASNVGGIPEITHDHQEGILIDPQNVQSLVNAFTYYTDHAGDVERIRSAFHKKITSTCTLENMLKRTVAVYEH